MPTKLALNGKEINLTSDNTIIKSTNFNVDKNGNMTCSNANITGGKINVTAKKGVSNFTIETKSGPRCSITGDSIDIRENSSTSIPGQAWLSMYEDGTAVLSLVNRDLTSSTEVNSKEIITPKLTQGSLKSIKKNIKKLNIDATELIKNADICSYNLKSEKKGTKKHIGLVIGGGYNCPTEVISENGQGVEQYSMTSVAWKSIQELIKKDEDKDKQIAELTQRLEKLEAIINEKN